MKGLCHGDAQRGLARLGAADPPPGHRSEKETTAVQINLIGLCFKSKWQGGLGKEDGSGHL